MTLEFFVTSLVVVLLPGTGVIYTLAIGLGRGFKASVAAAVGCTMGIVPAAVASIVGLAALLRASAIAFQIVKALGVLYLFYMAWSILKDDGVLTVREDVSPKSYFRIALSGTLLNVLNPKLSLFFVAFLPQFVSRESGSVTLSLVALAGAFMLMTLIVFVAYGAFAASARDYVIARPKVLKWLRRSFAGAFGFLGAKLALQTTNT
ncbi:MAG: LysE family translocator [Gammaproteobacteria bacterium]|nr:LysE family translocator [Gammaproteobacteria bacterium]